MKNSRKRLTRDELYNILKDYEGDNNIANETFYNLTGENYFNEGNSESTKKKRI